MRALILTLLRALVAVALCNSAAAHAGNQLEEKMSDSVRAARANNQPLLPRASLLGVLLRTALADRFTHGLGGKIYEEVSNDWIRRWLDWQPPRFDVVSATLRLPLENKHNQANFIR